MRRNNLQKGRTVAVEKWKQMCIRDRIDGKYALFGRPNIVKSYWECVLDPKHVKKGGKHTVEFTVTDGCGNETIARESFVW